MGRQSLLREILGLLLFTLCLAANSQHVPIVKTTSGLLRGFSPYPDVHAYLGIPYAQLPVGELRFAPPQPITVNDSTPIDCYDVSPGCFQLTYITAFADRSTGMAESENMMSINIWKPAESNHSLPVMIFLYGGGFTGGANGLPEYSGVEFVAAQKDIIFVSINYRVNIFGFPNSPAIETKNPGLLDQRLAVEWLRDNIHAFGGDHTQMTLLGHSAGSISIAYWSYAYKNDPIVRGLIELSGQPGLIATDDGSSWASIANTTRCRNTDAVAELECLRAVPGRTLKRAMSPNNTPALTDSVLMGGTPVVDNITVFPLAEYTTRGLTGEFAKVPLLVTHTLNEADGVLPFSPLTGVNQTVSDEFTLASWHCPVAAMANYSAEQNIPTWRYLYAGSFVETTPYSWMRPYHGSDLTLILGQVKSTTYQDIGPELQNAQTYLQNAIASFVRDPANGLEHFGWPRYNASGPTLVKIFGNESAAVSLEESALYDAPCRYI